eukprot:scaffold7745_cov103-Cylindrotheca_fusiformis.AAC.5
MSSLAATQADGYYLPPEYYDSGTYKKKSKNQFAKSKGHNQYEKSGVVRYKGVCLSCKQSIMRGTRYNAKKVETDESYFTTKILEFQMACRNCSHKFRIRTNPQERGFDYVEGIKIQAGQEPSTELLESTFSTNMNVRDGLAKLEAAAQGKKQRQTEYEELQRLQKMNHTTMLNDANSNANIRSRFRKDRKEKRARIRHATNLGWRQGMEVVGQTLEDAVMAKDTVFGKSKDTEKRRFVALKRSSIFSNIDKPKRRRRRKVEEEADNVPIPLFTSSNPLPLDSVVASQANTEALQPRRTKKIVTGHAATVQSSLTAAPLTKAAAMSEMFAGYGSDTDEDS